MQRKSVLELLQVVVLQHQGVLHHFGRHAGAGGVAQSGQARAGFDQQRIGMAVVAALELDELAAARGPARQADGRHGRLGARADQAHHVHAGHVAQDFFGQFDFALGRRAKREALEQRFLHRFEHRWVAVAQNHRAPGADVVDIALAVGIPKMGALGAGHKARRAAHGFEGAHWRVDATGDDGGGALEEFEVAVSGGFHWAVGQKERVGRGRGRRRPRRNRCRRAPKTGGRAAHGPCPGAGRTLGCGPGR